MTRRRTTQLGVAAASILTWAPIATFADEPLSSILPIVDASGTLTYPEGAPVPRYATEFEKRLQAALPPFDLRGSTPPPDGPIVCPGEYAPMDGILIAWEGTTAWLNILAQMARQITTVGNANVYVAVDTVSEQSTATTLLNQNSVNMSRVQFVVRTTDTIWIRDYGPRYIYQGNCRAIVDHTYNRPRPFDDAFSSFFATFKRHAFYEMPLVHGGGNYHLDSLGRSHATRLINNENPGLTEQQIFNLWNSYQNVDTTFYTPFPTTVDATQHIDMWVQILGDNAAMVSDWPFNVGSTQDVICDNAAASLQSMGYTVTRIPARSLGGTHYTYTNVVICNNLILLPTYTNSTIVSAGHNAQALAAWQTAAPDKTIVQIDCQAIVTAAGVMHCIVMHVPQHLGGVNPTAYLRTLRGGEVLTPGAQADIRWISDDDILVSNVDILLSLDGGANYDEVIAAATADDGSFLWTVPDLFSNNARIRVVARDASGNTGFDQSPGSFTINGTPTLLGDMNCDGVVSVGDIAGFVLALTDPAGYATTFPACDINAADTNQDSTISVGDIASFVALLTGG